MKPAAGFLRQLFDAAIAAVSADRVIPPALARLPRGNLIVIGAGKAAAAMARALERRRGSVSGLVIVPYGHAVTCRHVEIVEAAHPVPDAAGVRASERMLRMVSVLGPADTVVCLLSGGGSALLTLPAAGLTLEDKQSITSQLLRSGAAIDEINCVRRHLSAIKGGRLARACAPARVITLAISDVCGNDPAVIASGPTVADVTTAAGALAVLDHYAIEAPQRVRAHLERGDAGIAPGDTEFHVLASSEDALDAAAVFAREHGVQALVLGDLAGDASALAVEHAGLARAIAAGRGQVEPPCLVLSGGETTVRVRGPGRGGRNGEYGLRLSMELGGHAQIAAIACDTDGIDGTGDNAGCIVLPDTLIRAGALGRDPARALAANDSYGFFAALGDLVMTGPTLTNVNDFRAMLIAVDWSFLEEPARSS